MNNNILLEDFGMYINQAIDEYIDCPGGIETEELNRYLRVVDFCQKNFTEDVCNIYIDDPSRPQKYHNITIEWKEDIFKGSIKGKIIALLFLVDEFFQSSDRQGNISWSMNFYNTYVERG